MANYTLTILDTSGIQNYIFGSNRLKENIGASELVERTTRQWPMEILKEMRSNIIDAGTGKLDDNLKIELDALDVEVVYSGGGNSVVLFKNENKDNKLAIDFTKKFSHKVLSKAPGLEIVIVHRPFNWDTDALSCELQEAFKDLFRKKNNRLISVPLLGLSVTAFCQSTGLVATEVNDRGQLVSSEIAAKLAIADDAEKRLEQLLPKVKHGDFKIPRDFDELGRTIGETSYIAVVHSDGNGMGRKIEAIADMFPEPKDNREYIMAMRKFSRSVERAAVESLRSTVDLLLDSIVPKNGKQTVKGKFVLKPYEKDKDQLCCLPFRPIVFGGDDVTFISDGRIGLSLAIHYLSEFEKQDLEVPEDSRISKKPFACAGIAIVKSHYPFARAYSLSDELCRNAKIYIKEKIKSDASALDWHVAMSSITGTIDEIRKREYEVDARLLTMKPLQLRKGSPEHADSEWRSWEKVRDVIQEFQTSPIWAGKRNKVKALRQALREGPDAVKLFRTIFNLKSLPELSKSISAFQETGWSSSLCGYFDPIEMIDLFIEL